MSARGAGVATLVYCAANAAITLSGGPALALDDVKLNVLTQSLQLGYLPDNPPLFEWALYAIQQAVGPTLLSFAIAKYLFFCAGAAFTYLAVKEASEDGRVGALAVFALPLIPQIGWNFHQTLTHSTALFAAVAFFWCALLRLERARGAQDFALLGAALGVGLVSKYSFIAAFGAALIAAMMRPALRAALATPRLAVTLLAAAMIAAPHLYWLVTAGADGLGVVQARLGDDAPYGGKVLSGLAALLWSATSFLAPLCAALCISGRGQLFGLNFTRNVLSDASLIALAGLAGAVIVFGVSNFQERYALAFLYPAYLWAISAAFKARLERRAVQALLACALVLAGVLATARALEIIRPGAPFCDDCRQHIPYRHLFDALSGAVTDSDTLVAFDDHTAGNLRRLFPDARVISSHQPFYTPPKASGGRCRFIWSEDVSPPPPPSVIAAIADGSLSDAGGEWDRLMAGEQTLRNTVWRIAIIDRSTEFGADLCRD